MRVLFSLLVTFFGAIILQAQESALTVKLTEAQGSIRGEASGPTVLQFHGYYLHEILKAIDNSYAFRIETKRIDNKRFSLEVEGDISDKDKIIEEINKQLKEMGHEVELRNLHPEIFVLEFNELGSCDLSGGEVSSESLLSTTWKAKCVTVDKLIDRLVIWNPWLMIDAQGQGEVKIPQIKLKKTSLKDIQKQLSDQGINLIISDELSLRKYITGYG